MPNMQCINHTIGHFLHCTKDKLMGSFQEHLGGKIDYDKLKTNKDIQLL